MVVRGFLWVTPDGDRIRENGKMNIDAAICLRAAALVLRTA